jgi:hypothetical protein
MSVQEPPAELSYAPPIPWHRRKRYQRLIWGAAFGLLILAVYLYWQRRALTHALPVDQVVYETDPVEASKLIANGPETYMLVPYFTHDGSKTARRQAAAYFPNEWANLQDRPFPMAFLHERKTPRGESRLVAVGTSSSRIGDEAQPLIIAGQNYVPATSRLRSRLLSSSSGEVNGASSYPFLYVIRHSGEDRLRLYAAQPDPHDASRFVFAYELNGQRGSIAGWIAEDETIRLEVLDGPVVLERLPDPPFLNR